MCAVPTRSHDPGSPFLATGSWMRRRRRTLLFAGYAFVLSGFWIAMIFDVAGKQSVYEHNGGLAVFVLFFLVLAAASATLGVRVARCGLWIGADELVVRGPLRTWHVAAGCAEGFEPGVTGSGNRMPCPVLTRTDGRPVGVWALGSDALTFGYRRALMDMHPLCEALNGLLANIEAQAQAAAV
jgi:hypothetical protein